MKAPTVSLLLVLLAACDAPRATEASDPATLRATATPTPAATPVSFRKELREGNHRFVLQTTGKGAQRLMELRVEKNGRELLTNTQAVEGTVEDAVATNLNNDDSPELLVFITDAGSGSYGQLVGYEFNSQGRRTLSLPELSGVAAKGYQGHDTFKVEGQEVVRTFPVYLDADPNCCPSGGQRAVQYKLPAGSTVFKQVNYRNQTR
ncbi:PliI family lysozyme inhibitor of I-type lysozyme [uncultured Hymenobacter sp.]|uniref:PliI family lysozyme inhibitor of I-type lysozyme n=1 Tax=uncultured Hymenobacter sp. TaxID=170016 RepID=UPI0035CA31DE